MTETIDKAGYSRVDILGSAWTWNGDPPPPPTIWGDRGRLVATAVGVWVGVADAEFVPRLPNELYWSPDVDTPSFIRRVASQYGTAKPWRLSYVDLP